MAVEILHLSFDQYHEYRRADKIGISPKILAVQEGLLGYLIKIPFYGMNLGDYLDIGGSVTEEMMELIQTLVNKMHSEEIYKEVYSENLLLEIRNGKMEVKIRM